MSEIDSYKHECIGMVYCPSDYWPPPYFGQPENKHIPLYLLKEDALSADASAYEFQAKNGDLLLGGGSGETPALRISMPEALISFTHGDKENRISIKDNPTVGDLQESLYHAYWSMDHAFMFGAGYVKLGWEPHKIAMEIWLIEHILAFVTRECPELW